MSQTEEIDGQEVTHRCWVLSDEDGAWAQQIAHPGIFTLLTEAEYHLWTTGDDTQFIRLAITGDHWGECPDHCDDVYQHDNLRRMLLWMELSDVGGPVEIEAPGGEQIGLKVPPTGLERTGEIAAPIDELPPARRRKPSPPCLKRLKQISESTPMRSRESISRHQIVLATT